MIPDESVDSARPEGLTLRPARTVDSRSIWEWRNDPVTRAASGATKPVPWQSHQKWLRDVLADRSRCLLIAERGDEAVAVLRFDEEEPGDWRVSINIAPEARGQGLARTLLESGARWMSVHHRARRLLADVRRTNAASAAAFARSGYDVESIDDDWIRYVYVASTDDSA